MGKASKIILTIVIIIASFGAIGYVLSKNKKESEEKTRIVAEKNATVAVRVDTVKKTTPDLDIIANGSFAPSQELSFAAEKSGRVVSVLVKEGSYVRKGQTLATIRVDQLSVDLQSARANYQNALAEKERFENAYKTGGVTRQQVDQVNLNLANAQARLQQAEINLGDANIRSSIDGIVNKKMIEPGSVVSPGTPLFEIVNVSKLKLKVTVNEAQVAQLSLGKQVRVKASVFPDKEFSGRITFIAPKADQALNFPVEIEIANNNGNQLKAGMYGTAVFDFPNQAPVITIPRVAFVGSVNSNQVFVTDGKTAQLRNVVAGRILGEQVEVLSGLNEGEMVIISGQINLTNETPINILK